MNCEPTTVEPDNIEQRGAAVSTAIIVILIAVIPIGASGVLGIVLILRGCRAGRPYASCGNTACRYDLSGTIGHADRCPECGSGFAAVGINPPSKPRNMAMIVTGLAMVVAPFVLGTGVVSMVIARNRAVMAQQTIIMPLPNPSPPAAALTFPNQVPQTPPDGESADTDNLSSQGL